MIKHSTLQRVAAAVLLSALSFAEGVGADGVPTIRLTAVVDPPAAPPGTVVELALKVETPDGWVAYDLEQLPESVLPTEIQLDASEQFAALENFTAPPAQERQDPIYGGRIVRYFATSPTFRRKLLIADDAKPGTVRVTGRIDVVIANRRAKKTIRARQYPFEATVEVTAPPAVADGARGATKAAAAVPSPIASPTTTSADAALRAGAVSVGRNRSTPFSTRPPGRGTDLAFDIQLDDMAGLEPVIVEKAHLQVGPLAVALGVVAGLSVLLKKTWNP